MADELWCIAHAITPEELGLRSGDRFKIEHDLVTGNYVLYVCVRGRDKFRLLYTLNRFKWTLEETIRRAEKPS